ncbi:pentapeptide repeat-containing protein [Micromonospora sp. SH-82]|uniref:pentapeptide repeat-containing protein n=1 Tax=Micromonospora sp. SH-82 TaxID=3132938 RepID=UPI003EBD6CE2
MSPRRVSTTRSSAARKVREPRSPLPPSELVLFDASELESESELESRAFYSLSLAGQDADSMTFTQCRFRGADLSSCRLDQVTMTDCLVTDSSLANIRADGGSMTRVRLSQCRMTGVTLADGLLRDVTIKECRADLSAWRMTKFDAVSFVECNLSGADFTNADLSGAVFRHCDLTSAVFHHAAMEGARFRGCNLAGVGDVSNWKGAIVHHTDLMSLSYGLARAAGIHIEDDDS